MCKKKNQQFSVYSDKLFFSFFTFIFHIFSDLEIVVLVKMTNSMSALIWKSPAEIREKLQSPKTLLCS